jgi:hypothetical protein
VQLRMLFSIRHQHPTFDPWNTEVPAEMGQVERVDRPGDHDKVDLIRPGKENRDVADRFILKVDPQIGQTLGHHLASRGILGVQY